MALEPDLNVSWDLTSGLRRGRHPFRVDSHFKERAGAPASVTFAFRHISAVLGKDWKGVEDFHAERKYQRPCNTHFSFHLGSRETGEKVMNWLSKLEASSAKPFSLLIHMVREKLVLDYSKRPRHGRLPSLFALLSYTS